MDTNFDNQYPYGEFPYKYTVKGQERLKREWQERNQGEPYEQTKGENKTEQKVENMSTNISQPSTMSSGGLGANNLLPLLTKMKSGNMNTKDMLSMFSPMLKSPLPLKELLDAFGGIKSPTRKQPTEGFTSTQNSKLDINKLKKI